MEVKKNPNVDPKRNSKLYFQLGLVAVLLLTYLGIELKTYDKVEKEVTEFFTQNNIIEEEETILTMPPTQKLPPPPPPAPVVIEVVKDEIKIEEKKIETTEAQQDTAVEVVNATEVGDGDGDDFDADIEVPFAVIEQVPLFPGCEKMPKAQQMQCFQEKMNKHVQKHFRYPEEAAEDEISGRVFVAFLIDKDGNFTNIRTRGPKNGKLLEEEAARIFSKLPKIKPGKQRGKAVKVSYTYPIVFRLN